MHEQMIHFVRKRGGNLVRFIDHYTPAIYATFQLDKYFDLNHSEENCLQVTSQPHEAMTLPTGV